MHRAVRRLSAISVALVAANVVVSCGGDGGSDLTGSATAISVGDNTFVPQDITVAKGQVIPTSGKQFTLTPNTMVGSSVQYANGPYYVRLKVKHTGKQYATLMNDEEAPAYTTGDLDAGYKFADIGMMKSPLVRMNISNIGNARYRNPSSNSVVNAKAVGSTAASTVFYYLGAPRLITFTFSADFQ